MMDFIGDLHPHCSRSTRIDDLAYIQHLLEIDPFIDVRFAFVLDKELKWSDRSRGLITLQVSELRNPDALMFKILNGLLEG
jgi:hypothetical protein